MIVFPFTLFYLNNQFTGGIFTGFYDLYESYALGTRFSYQDGFAFESGLTIPRTGFFTGYSFLSNFILYDTYENYNVGYNVHQYPSGTEIIYKNLYTRTGRSFYQDILLTDEYENLYIGETFYVTGRYSGLSIGGTEQRGHTYGGYIRPQLYSYISTVPNVSTYNTNPAEFSGYTAYHTGGVDRIENIKLGWLNKTTGLFFTGASMRFQRPPSIPLGNFTCEFALKISGVGPLGGHRIIDSNYNSGFIAQVEAGSFSFRLLISGTAATVPNYTINTGHWAYYSIVRNGSNAKVYISGIEKHSFTVVANPITIYHPIYLMNNGTTSPDLQPVYGYVDEFRFWDYARTSGQIFSGASGVVDKSSSGLLGYLSLPQV